MTRRQMIGTLAAIPLAAQDSPILRNIGGAPAGFPVRSRAGRGSPGGFDFVIETFGKSMLIDAGLLTPT